MKRRVVITGLGAVTGLGCKISELWAGVRDGRSGVGPIDLFDTTEFKVHFGGQVRDFTTDGYIDPREAKRLDRFAQFAVVAADDAIRDAGLDFSKEDSFRCGSIIGSGVGGLSEIEAQHGKLVQQGPSRVSPLTIPKMMVNAAAGQVSIRFKLRGPSTAVATACASAANAIGDAMKAIQYDDADIMITGGSEAGLTPMGLSGFGNMKALSTRNDDPQRASRPFDLDRDGFILSEGAGILVLEELEHAKARGAKIYAELVGYGLSSDGGHITQPDENGTGAARAMENALRDAKLNAEQVGYVNAHGTSTPLGDKAETRAVHSVFGPMAKKIAVSSTKSQLGHLLGASGGVELIISALAVNTGILPPTINLETPDPDCDLDYIPNTAREQPVAYAMSNSFGFGGHNASLIVGRI
jgi:3-oxoacyl-[acyl-carrier-protein] synthase II